MMSLSKAIRASFVRLVFLIHGMVGLFSLVYTTQISTYWFIGVTMVVMMTEIVMTYRLNKYGEWKWFVPSAFIYLCTIVPVIWLLELAMLDFRVELKHRLGVDRCPTDLGEYIRDSVGNVTLLVSDKTNDFEESLNGSREFYSTTLQQSLMLVLIVGRWLQPRGDLTRDQLSQLLLVYIGMAADMLEFSSETLRVDQIACDQTIFNAILAVWSWSLTQFSLGLTSTKGRKTRSSGNMEEDGSNSAIPVPPSDEIYWRAASISSLELKNISHVKLTLISSGICGTELWALLISLCIQDGPYLVTRLYIIFSFHVYDRSMIFFTCKNALLLCLMAYRLFVVIVEAKRRNKKKLTRLQARTQPAGQDRQGNGRSDLTSKSKSIFRKKKQSRNNNEVVINMHGNEDLRMSTSVTTSLNKNEDIDIYQIPPDEESLNIEESRSSSNTDNDNKTRKQTNSKGHHRSSAFTGHDNQVYQHGHEENDDDSYDHDDTDDDVGDRKEAYVVAGNENSIDLGTKYGRPPTPPPFPSLLIASSLAKRPKSPISSSRTSSPAESRGTPPPLIIASTLARLRGTPSSTSSPARSHGTPPPVAIRKDHHRRSSSTSIYAAIHRQPEVKNSGNQTD